MVRRSATGAAVLGTASLCLLAAAWQPEEDPTSFSADVLPVLKAHCGSCHQGKGASGGLDLTSAAGILKGGDSGPAVLAGKPEKSLLIQRLNGDGGLARMPMGFAPLPKEKIDAITAWIRAGAKIDKAKVHWAYVAPIRPRVPQPKSKGWVKNPIDAFVLERLGREGLSPSAEAPRETLLRRVSLDLVGLPPSPKEIDDFQNDHRPDAYERVVDRLLASPHYGERQARVWLDLSRYADSDGYEKDLNRTAWKYRDWLIEAFNRNLPYDRFTIEQIGGDLLPNPTTSQRVATGFHRNTMFNQEGGVDQEEAHFNVVLDRVATTSTVWMGTTLGCARCHDHKYDPFTQLDHYRMAAFFSNSVILPRGSKAVGEEKWFESEIEAGTPDQFAKRATLRRKAEELRRTLRADTPELAAAYEAWKSSPARPEWSTVSDGSAKSSGTASLTEQSDGSFLAGGDRPDRDTYVFRGRLNLPSVTGIRIEVLPHPTLGSGGPGRSDNGNFVLTGVSVRIGGDPVKLVQAASDYAQQGFGPAGAIDADAQSGWAISGALGRAHELIADFDRPIPGGGQDVEVRLEQQSAYPTHTLGRFRITFTGTPAPSGSVLPPDIAALLAKTSRTAAEERRLSDHFRATCPQLAPQRGQLATLEADLAALQSQIPTALVMMDKPTSKPLMAYMRTRGEFLGKAELVEAGTPAVLPPLSGKNPNRLALARWLVSRANPLAARVQVNRMWEQLFGRGLVETSEDFGTQGSRPTHPELLDWLAVEFMHRGWDMKAINKLIVMSATYRQSSNLRPDLVRKDPQNLLLARAPRYRMEAEMIRDQALAASGLLSRKIGGPSVFPFQPEGVWDNPYNGERWNMSSNGDQHRRGIYTFLKRTAPYASFLTFDSTSRESCTPRRIRTNTPLQALTMLNDGAMLDAAKALGARMRKEGGKTAASRIDYGYRLMLGRAASKTDLSRTMKLHSTLLARYRKDPNAAARLAGSVDEAVWTLVANVLMNLDEAVTKG